MTSKRHVRRKACAGKHPYRRQADARAAARQLYWKDRQPMNAYRCPWCSAPGRDVWHVGHSIGQHRGR